MAASVTIPTPAEYARGWYGITSPTQALKYEYNEVAMWIRQYAAWAGEIPQVNQPTQGDQYAATCQETVNALLRANADAAKRMGHDGAFRLMNACMSEGRGRVPAGYMQQVASELMRAAAPAWYQSLGTWISLGVVGLVGAVWWNDRNATYSKPRRAAGRRYSQRRARRGRLLRLRGRR